MTRRQREIVMNDIVFLRISLSRKTLKTGEVKQMTIRSPIGIRGIAARQEKLAVEIEHPYRKRNGKNVDDFPDCSAEEIMKS